MSRPKDYLQLPLRYCRWLGEMRWTPDREAIEYMADNPAIVLTFAMSGEIALFLEGFHAGGARPIHFGFILHLLHLLRLGFRDSEAARHRGAERLARAFREEGRPLQHAGALCAWLCRAVPPVADPPDIAEVCRTLREPPSDPLAMRPDRHRWVPPEDPPRSPGDFQEQVLEALEDSLRRHCGTGSARVGGRSAKPVSRSPARCPGRSREALEELEHRPRLAAPHRWSRNWPAPWR